MVGLLQPSSKNIRLYWLDFITSCLPQLQQETLSQMLPHIVKCICSILQNDTDSNIYDSVAAKDLLALLKSLHILLMHCLSQTASAPSVQPHEPSTVTTLGAPVKFVADLFKDVVFHQEEHPQETPHKDMAVALLKEFPLIWVDTWSLLWVIP